MIGWLTGVVVEVTEQTVILSVQGVGYEVNVPTTLIASARLQEETALYIHHHFVQDQQALYGFATDVERKLFRLLISVSKVGPKLAIGILSELSLDQLVSYIRTSNAEGLKSVKGVGQAVAERIPMELRAKVDEIAYGVSATMDTETKVRQEALDALIGLGHGAMDARRVVNAAYFDGIEIAELLRKSLQLIKI